MSPSNLTNVYNQNPTLQSMYSLPDYLALFGQDSSSTPQLATAYVDPTTSTTSAPASTGIPSIINQNLNKGGGEGDGGVNNIIGGKDYGYKSSFASTGTTPEENENFLNDIGEGTIDDDDMPGFDLKGLGAFFSNLPTPFNLAKKGLKAFNDYQAEKKAREKAAFDKAEKERIAKEAIAEAERIEAAKIEAAQLAEIEAMRQRNEQTATGGYQAGYGGGFMDVPSGTLGGQNEGLGGQQGKAGGTATMGSSKDGGLMGYGGKSGTPRYKRTSYFDGGIVSLRRR